MTTTRSAAKAKAAVPAKAKVAAKTSSAKTSSAKSAAAAKPQLITLRQLATSISETHGLPKKQANDLLSGTIELISDHLKKGARIRIAGLGTLEVRKRSARLGRNPATGEVIKIKASKKVAFRPAKDLSEAI
jgi:DNA-binding protein HU-beta